MCHSVHTVFSKLKKFARLQRYENFISKTYISLKNSYIFVALAKNAHCSILQTLLNIELLGNFQIEEQDTYFFNHENIPLLNPRQIFDFEKYNADNFTFCFVRNPYERLASAYLDKIYRDDFPFRASINGMLGRDLSSVISFEDFVLTVCKNNFYNSDPHFSSQYYHSCQDFIKYDFIGKFENFDEDLSFVVTKLGYNVKDYYGSYDSHATKDLQASSNLYTSRLKDIVYEKFEYDFLAFNYAR